MFTAVSCSHCMACCLFLKIPCLQCLSFTTTPLLLFRYKLFPLSWGDFISASSKYLRGKCKRTEPSGASDRTRVAGHKLKPGQLCLTIREHCCAVWELNTGTGTQRYFGVSPLEVFVHIRPKPSTVPNYSILTCSSVTKTSVINVILILNP